MKKIINLKKLSQKIKIFKKNKKRVVLCHGAFDLLHPGHIDHLELAKKGNDILVVSLTTDSFIKKSINSPFYNQSERAKFLSNLQIVDFVCYSESSSSISVLNMLKPNVYCKGEEYKKNDHIGNISKEKQFCKNNNISFKLIGKEKFSSNKIFANKFFQNSDMRLVANIKKYITTKNINLDKIFNQIEKLKILVIGETIFDKYTYVSSKGISPKSNTLSCSIDTSKTMPGGALATYKYLKQFTKQVELLSAINSDLHKKNIKLIGKNNIKSLYTSVNFPQLVKERIVEIDKIQNIKKILTLNHFSEIKLEKKMEKQFDNFLNRNLMKFDIVIVQDFGHGLISEKMAKIIQKKSRYLSLNVQTNSLNYGFNIINRKFKKADLFTLDKKELELYSEKKNINFDYYLKELTKKLNSKHSFLTCGDKFSLGYDNRKMLKIDTLGKDVIDTIGAGDIFHATSTLLSFIKKDLFLSLFISQISGALAVKITGNSDFPKIHQIRRTFDLYVDSIK